MHMTNINCSAKCNYEQNGKCTLNHVGITSDVMGYGTDCAYYTPKKEKKKVKPSSQTPPRIQ